jgi:hypothetical protein
MIQLPSTPSSRRIDPANATVRISYRPLKVAADFEI